MAFTSINQHEYDTHFFTLSNINMTGQTEFGFQLTDDGGSSYETGYSFTNHRSKGPSSSGNDKRNSEGQNVARLCGDIDDGAGSVANGYFYMYHAGDAAKYTMTTSNFTFMDNADIYNQEFGSQTFNTASLINGIKFGQGAGSLAAFASGTISCYGIRYS